MLVKAWRTEASVLDTSSKNKTGTFAPSLYLSSITFKSFIFLVSLSSLDSSSFILSFITGIEFLFYLIYSSVQVANSSIGDDVELILPSGL